MPPTLEHAGETATANFANTMRDALQGVVAPEAPIAPVTAPPTPIPPKPPENPATTAQDLKPAATEAPKKEEPQIDKWPRTAQEWKKWNEVRESEYQKRDNEIKSWAAKYGELETKLKAINTPAQHPEYEIVKAERDKYSEVLKTVAVERHPKFKDYFDAEVSSQIEMAKQVVGTEKSESIARVLSLPEGAYRDSQIEELVADMSPLKQAQIGGVLNSLSAIQRERSTEIAKSTANFDRIQKENQEKAQASRLQLEAKFNDTVTQLKAKNPLYQTREKDEAWNKGVNDRVELAKHFLLGNPTAEQLVEASANAAAYPALIANQIEILKENESLKAQIKSLSAASPTITTTTKTPENGGTPAPLVIPANSRPMDALASGFFKNLGPLNQQQ